MQPTPENAARGIESAVAGIEETQEEISGAEDYEQLMNSVRGNSMTMEDRRMELAGIVGLADAKATPESVLAVAQPAIELLTMKPQEVAEGMNASGPAQPFQPEGIGAVVIPEGFADGGLVMADRANRMAGHIYNTAEPQFREIIEAQPERMDYAKRALDIMGRAKTREDYMKEFGSVEERQKNAKAQAWLQIANIGLGMLGAPGGGSALQRLGAAAQEPVNNISGISSDFQNYKDDLRTRSAQAAAQDQLARQQVALSGLDKEYAAGETDRAALIQAQIAELSGRKDLAGNLLLSGLKTQASGNEDAAAQAQLLGAIKRRAYNEFGVVLSDTEASDIATAIDMADKGSTTVASGTGDVVDTLNPEIRRVIRQRERTGQGTPETFSSVEPAGPTGSNQPGSGSGPRVVTNPADIDFSVVPQQIDTSFFDSPEYLLGPDYAGMSDDEARLATDGYNQKMRAAREKRETAVDEISKTFTKSGISELTAQLQSVENAFNGLVGEALRDYYGEGASTLTTEELLDRAARQGVTLEKLDIPGIGYAASTLPDAAKRIGYGVVPGMKSQAALDYYKALQSLQNVELKERSGAAVTAQEFERFLKEFGQQSMTGELSSINALNQAFRRLRKAMAQDLAAGQNPKYLQYFRATQPEATVIPNGVPFTSSGAVVPPFNKFAAEVRKAYPEYSDASDGALMKVYRRQYGFD